VVTDNDHLNDCTDLAFMNVLDIDCALNYSKQPYSPHREALFLFRQGKYAQAVRDHYRIQTSVLEAIRKLEVGKHGLPLHSPPRIEYKMITTDQGKAELEVK
jgi:hypothetical protein